MASEGPVPNTDRELWRERDDYYADSIHVTEGGGIGINGVYHHVGKQHLHRYLSEFDFRYNSRKESDGDRTLMALTSTGGKRLMLRDSKQTN